MNRIVILRLTVLIFLLSIQLCGIAQNREPVSPKSSKEAKALLNIFYNISGKYILTGQHNYPNAKDRNTLFAKQYIGKTPVIYSTDWGFSENGDKDNYLARPEIVKEVIRQHQLGSVITICWHAVPPTDDEPTTFRPLPDADPNELKSVQGNLLDQQFIDVLTPGTDLYKKWCAQVDTIAVYLKKLQDAGVPVLWRPYHEMNGEWFWWGGRHGEYGTKELYKQIYDRLVNYHKLNNLIWVWSVDRVHNPDMNYSHYYPGNEYVDILALDVYGSDFKKDYYNSLLFLANGKPVVLGEVGNPPKLEILDEQPKWAYWVTWAGMVRNTLKKQYDIYIDDPRVLFLEDMKYKELISEYREVCGLTSLDDKLKTTVDFSGKWIFNEELSILDNRGASQLPYQLQITQTDNELLIQEAIILEWDNHEIIEEKYILDGSEMRSEFWNSPKITTASFSETGDTLYINSKVIFNRGGQAVEMNTTDEWTLQKNEKYLYIHKTTESIWGNRDIIMIYTRTF